MSNIKKAIDIFTRHAGLLKTAQAIKLGVYPSTLYRLRDQGVITCLSRGLYRMTSLPELSDPDLVTIALRVPKAVLCLVSALSYHNLTTQVPHDINIALPKSTKAPQIKYPPIRTFYYEKATYEEGIEKHIIDGISVNIYSAEKTVVDCFKFRNKIGLDIAIEALRLCHEKRKSMPVDFMKFAETARVTSVIMPYLQAIT